MDQECLIDQKKDNIIVGLDVGQVNVGFGFVCNSELYAEAFRGYNDFEARFCVANMVFQLVDRLCEKYRRKPDLIVIEDYIKSSFSHVSFGMGENGGIYRVLSAQRCCPILLCPPRYLTDFFLGKRVSSKIGKEELAKILRKYFGFASDESNQIDKYNETDALAYALLGAYFMGELKVETSKQSSILEKLRERYFLEFKHEPK